MIFSSDLEPKVILIVPCYNESQRWNNSYWDNVAKIPRLSLLFVNDGSSDNTLNLIKDFSSKYQFEFISLASNRGKAEAIRAGFLQGFKSNPFGIGFLDADAAFSVEEVNRQVNSFFQRNPTQDSSVSVWSSRVQLAVRDIHRRLSRHYLARVLVTLLATRLKFSIYDPQSGLKIYRNQFPFQNCFEVPFKSRWFVDLEIYLRFKQVSGVTMKVWEEPVATWNDVKGSKINSLEYLRILRDISRILR